MSVAAVSWNTLTSSDIERGLNLEILRTCAKMQKQGLAPNDLTLVLIIKMSGNIADLQSGTEDIQCIANEGCFDMEHTGYSCKGPGRFVVSGMRNRDVSKLWLRGIPLHQQ